MRVETPIEVVARGLLAIVKVLTWIATAILSIMILLVVANVVGRFVFKQPLLGTIEIVDLLMVLLVFSALSFTQTRRAHVKVELLVGRFPIRVQTILASIMLCVGAAFFINLGLQSGRQMLADIFPLIRATDVLSIPFAPFMFVIAFGSLLLGLEMLINSFHPLSPPEKREKEEEAI